MENNVVLDVIIALLQGVKNNNTLEHGQHKIKKCNYLLNQTIRQYQIPQDHLLVSIRAKELWDKISTGNIINYEYNNRVVKNVSGEIQVDKYRGGEANPYKTESLTVGSSFAFNDVFSDEHVVTVSDIIKELLALPQYDYDSVKKVLNRIYICKMLKAEDRQIKNRTRRSIDYRQVVYSDYLEAGIKIVGFDYDSKICQQQKSERESAAKIKEVKSFQPYSTKIFKRISETLVFTNKHTTIGARKMYYVYNSCGEHVGYVCMTNDKRNENSYGKAELYFENRYKDKKWCRFTSYGKKIDWAWLISILEEQGEYKCYVD